MIKLTFGNNLPSGYLELLSTRDIPAVLIIHEDITVIFSQLFDVSYVAVIDAELRQQMLSYPILMVGGKVAALSHITLALKQLTPMVHVIESLRYFDLGNGWHDMIADGAFLEREREPEPDWLL